MRLMEVSRMPKLLFFDADLTVCVVLDKVRAQLQARGAKTIRGLARTFRQLDSFDGNKKVDASEFHIGLNEAGCNLSKQEAAVSDRA